MSGCATLSVIFLLSLTRMQPWLRLRTHLFSILGPRYAGRQGGYTRVHKLGHQASNQAPLAVLELVDSPKDLRRAMVSRITARELALQHLGLSKNVEGKVQAPGALTDRTELQLAEDKAREVLESIGKRLHPVNQLGLSRVLSPAYVAAWEYCRPRPPLPSAAKAEELNELRKERQHTVEWQTGDGATGLRQSPVAYPHRPLDNEKGPYSAFFSTLRRNFHNQLDTLTTTPNSLVAPYLSHADTFYAPTSSSSKGPIAKALGNQAQGATNPYWIEKQQRNADRKRHIEAKTRKPFHLQALKLKPLVPPPQNRPRMYERIVNRRSRTAGDKRHADGDVGEVARQNAEPSRP